MRSTLLVQSSKAYPDTTAEGSPSLRFLRLPNVSSSMRVRNGLADVSRMQLLPAPSLNRHERGGQEQDSGCDDRPVRAPPRQERTRDVDQRAKRVFRVTEVRNHRNDNARTRVGGYDRRAARRRTEVKMDTSELQVTRR